MNRKLILRETSSEYFKDVNYKISLRNLPTPVSNSSSTLSVQTLTPVIAFDGMNTITRINQKEILDNIEILRRLNPDLPKYSKFYDENINNLEKIPGHIGIWQFKEYLVRMKNEYTQKKNFLEYLKRNLYNKVYATGLYNVGKDTVMPLNITNKIPMYFKTEGSSENINAYIIIRNIPIRMRRTLTSRSSNRYNYIFTYPQYIMNNKEDIDSISRIIFRKRNTSDVIGNIFYYSNHTNIYSSNIINKIGNSNIINRKDRNTI